MKGKMLAASAAVMMMGSLSQGYAADLSVLATKAPPAVIPPAAPPVCTGVNDFFTTNCQLYAYGIRFYGTVDAGYGYHTHGAPYDKFYASGTNYQLGKNSRSSMWVASPDALGQSNIGVSIKWPVAAGWSFIGQVELPWQTYSFNPVSAPHSLVENRGTPLNQQTSSSDSSSTGTWYGGISYAGISSEKYGTITVFRQRTLMGDVVAGNDVMNASNAFSAIGYSGIASGGGDGEISRTNSSVKYRVNLGNYRLGALALFGGYDLGNGATEMYEGQAGGDFKIGPGVLALDIIGGTAKNAVSLSLGGTAVTQTPLTASLFDAKNVMFVAGYKTDRLKLSAGYEWIEASAPSNPITNVGQGFKNIAGDFMCFGCTNYNFTNINNTTYSASNGTKSKILQIMWVGARYSLTDTVDVAVAYYHNDQSSYAASTANLLSCSTNNRSLASCAGTTDIASALVDWQFSAKWDTYLGVTYSAGYGGMNSGYLARNDLGTTGGVRFRW